MNGKLVGLISLVVSIVSIHQVSRFIPLYQSALRDKAFHHHYQKQKNISQSKSQHPEANIPIEEDHNFPRGPIPHILWFTYRHDVLQRQQPVAYYNNVMKTIQAYRTEWKEPDAPVYFLVDANCSELLQQVDAMENSNLTFIFGQERRGDFRGDLCRLAALYLHGGYYFDIDIEVVRPLSMDSKISFCTARDSLFGFFFQAFWASIPKHPVLRENIKTLMEFYVERKGFCYEPQQTGTVGPCTLVKAWNQTSPQQHGHARLLKETHLGWHKLYPNMTQRGVGEACHWVVHDPEEMEVYFYSRIVGSSKCG